MNVLFVSYDGMTDPLGQSQVIPYLSFLTQFGHTFTIISCEKPEKFKQNKSRIEEILKPVNIQWIPIPYTKKPPVLSTIKDLRKLNKTAAQTIAKGKFDLVHARSGIATLTGIYLKKKFGIKFLNDIRGFYADERIDGGMWRLNNPVYKSVYKFFKRKELEALTLADYNVCLTHKAKKEIQSWQTIPQPVKIEVVPCSVDLQLFNAALVDQQLVQKFRDDLGIAVNDFVFSYLGSLGGWYLNDEMMRFCALAQQNIPNSKFLFISNNGHEEIKELAAQYGIDSSNIKVCFGQRNEVPALLSLSHYSIFFIKPCYSKLSSSPTKHGEIMAMGIPVITNSGVGDVQEIMEKYHSGFVIDKMDNSSFKKVIDEIKSGQQLFNSDEIIHGANEFYNLENTIEVYKNVYDRIAQL